MTPSADRAREVAARAVSLTDADAAEALVVTSASALTRFAENRIHQNVAEENAQVSVRAVVGKRQGVASTNRLDDEGLAACCAAAAQAARVAPEDPDFPGLPGPAPLEHRDRVDVATRSFGPEERARAARAIIDRSSSRDLRAAGLVEVGDAAVAVANSAGVDAHMPLTEARSNVLSMSPRGGSGWASWLGLAASGLDPGALGEEAADIAVRSDSPGALDPGEQVVVLAPEAVADVVGYLAYAGFSAKAFAEGRSFMSGRLGERLMSPLVTIVDDALAQTAVGLTFDYEGQPKRRTPVVEGGVVNGPVTDSYWAAKLDLPNTGHALPAPNALGPYPLDLSLAAGEAVSVDDLIGDVKLGVYVTRFHYVNIEDPVKVTLTGMTRDGTFLIEDGRLTRPVRNLRFTQSAVEALAGVRALSRERRLVGDEGMRVLAPSMLLERFAFTGQTGE